MAGSSEGQSRGRVCSVDASAGGGRDRWRRARARAVRGSETNNEPAPDPEPDYDTDSDVDDEVPAVGGRSGGMNAEQTRGRVLMRGDYVAPPGKFRLAPAQRPAKRTHNRNARSTTQKSKELGCIRILLPRVCFPQEGAASRSDFIVHCLVCHHHAPLRLSGDAASSLLRCRRATAKCTCLIRRGLLVTRASDRRVKAPHVLCSTSLTAVG